MPNELNESMDILTDTDMWEDVAAIGAGYMGSAVAQSLIEDRIGFDLPNEAYGIGVAGVGYAYAPGEYNAQIATGGALYTLDSVGQRLGVKNRVTDIGGN